MASSERERVLREAIEIELKGKEFYTRARDRSRHELGRKIFAHLIIEEDGHLARIREVFQALQSARPWPESQSGAAVRAPAAEVFARLLKEQARQVKAESADLEALQTALGLEEKNERFYRELVPKSQDSFEREFFTRLADEERGHYQLISDTIQYLRDPETWFQEKQRSHLDGA